MKLRCHALTDKKTQCTRKAIAISEHGNALCMLHNRLGQYPAFCVPGTVDEQILIKYKSGLTVSHIAVWDGYGMDRVEKIIRDALEF